MRAPVYRNIETASTFLGLSFPLELLFVLFGYWACLTFLPAKLGIPFGVALYAGVRLVGHRRGPMFLQHWLVWQVRRLSAGGRLSAAARAPAPRFPYARYEWREAPLFSVQKFGVQRAMADGRRDPGDLSPLNPQRRSLNTLERHP